MLLPSRPWRVHCCTSTFACSSVLVISRRTFLQQLNANVRAGHAIHNPGVATPFPTGNSKTDQQLRISTLLSTLQNLNGPGVGCPAVSTVYGQIQQHINALP